MTANDLSGPDAITSILERIAAAVERPVLKPLLVPIEELCRLLGGISESTVYKRVPLGEIPAPVSVGGRSMWRVKDIEAWAEKLRPVR
ncbi:helix-turn-helix transcriptional regulator [Zavarzinella formosa]|uniref:helix-turn-helix transcriptional regulator n=1 Tax=Zavarzinella formosa TaxID=360055 RepID=UPI00031ABAE5|nr:helix-turn-helix domain-containing protein [Zavarzinella formosa]